MTKITSRPFGTVHGKQAILYTLDNGIISADITDYGAALTALRTMSRSGEMLDVLLGYESAEQYSLQDGLLRRDRRAVLQSHRGRQFLAWRHNVLSVPERWEKSPARRKAWV